MHMTVLIVSVLISVRQAVSFLFQVFYYNKLPTQVVNPHPVLLCGSIHYFTLLIVAGLHYCSDIYFHSSQVGNDDKMLVGKSSSTTTFQRSLQDTL